MSQAVGGDVNSTSISPASQARGYLVCGQARAGGRDPEMVIVDCRALRKIVG
jgi:hypothetical protein